MFLYFFSIEHFPIIVKIESDILFCAFSMQIHQKPKVFSIVYQFSEISAKLYEICIKKFRKYLLCKAKCAIILGMVLAQGR